MTNDINLVGNDCSNISKMCHEIETFKVADKICLVLKYIYIIIVGRLVIFVGNIIVAAGVSKGRSSWIF